VFIALNKIDMVPHGELLPMIDTAAGLGDYREIFPISAREHEGLDELKQALVRAMPEGPRYYPEDVVSDQPEMVIAGELVREQAVRLTHEELPHSIAVEVLALEPREGRDLVDMQAVIIVERESQKGIIIGKKGKMIKDIGSRARGEIEALLGSRVYLELSVKVRKKWRDDERVLGRLGL
jgi:GTP-binding protein Era